MTIEVGRIHIVDVEAGAQVPPEGHFLYARDTDSAFKSDGTTLTALAGGGSYTNEEAQDAVGAIVDASLTYDDATPTLSVADDGITDAKLRNSAALSVIGRSANSTGNPGDIVGANVGDVLQVLAGPTIGFDSLGAANYRRPSWDNPPASPHAYDDEFDTGTLDAKWTIWSAGTTNAAAAGTIDYTASLTTPIIDVATVPSWCVMQSDSSSVGEFGIKQAYTPSTDATFFFKVGSNARVTNANSEGSVYLTLRNSADANEYVTLYHSKNGTQHTATIQVSNNGVFTTLFPANRAGEDTPVGEWYLVMWKKSDVYHAGFATSGGLFSNFAFVTKTGVTTFDEIWLGMTTGNEVPSIIDGFDFFRYKASLDYSLVNP